MSTIEAQVSNRPIFKPSAETEKLLARMRTMEVGDVLTYEDMRETAGVDCQAERTHLQTARRHLLNEDQRVFANVRCVGIKRLDDAEIVEQESTTAIKVRRTVRGSMRRLSTVNPEKLPPLEAQRYRTTSASLGAIALCVTPASLGKVQQLVIKNGQADAKSTLALFGK